MMEAQASIVPTYFFFEVTMSVLGKKQPWSTPCIGICSATALGDEFCIGCKRTATEIYEWNSMTNEQKTALNQELRDRDIEGLS